MRDREVSGEVAVEGAPKVGHGGLEDTGAATKLPGERVAAAPWINGTIEQVGGRLRVRDVAYERHQSPGMRRVLALDASTDQ